MIETFTLNLFYGSNDRLEVIEQSLSNLPEYLTEMPLQ
jgi:hypothetical protein